MKKNVLITALILFSGFLQAQKKESVTVAAKTAFTAKFPNAKNVKWSAESKNEFEAEFKIGSEEVSANFDSSGKWLETETEINKKDLPIAVQKALEKDFNSYKIEETEKVEKPNIALYYELKVKKGEVSYEVKYATDGTLIKKELEKDDKD